MLLSAGIVCYVNRVEFHHLVGTGSTSVSAVVSNALSAKLAQSMERIADMHDAMLIAHSEAEHVVMQANVLKEAGTYESLTEDLMTQVMRHSSASLNSSAPE